MSKMTSAELRKRVTDGAKVTVERKAKPKPKRTPTPKQETDVAVDLMPVALEKMASMAGSIAAIQEQQTKAQGQIVDAIAAMSGPKPTKFHLKVNRSNGLISSVDGSIVE